MGRLSANWLKVNGFVGADVLCETGTKSGTGIKYCAKLFPACHTIELSYVKFLAAKKFLSNIPNIKCHHGDSAQVLKKVINPKRRTLFWLDAHWTASDQGSAGGPANQCPLLAELQAIFSFQWRVPPVILVDDAHMFQESFWHQRWSRPYDKAQWPRVEEVNALVGKHGFNVRTLPPPNDVLIIQQKPPVIHGPMGLDHEDDD